MGNQLHVNRLGDQTYDIAKELHGRLHSETDILLLSLFERIFCALREEVGKLPLEQRTQFRRFSSLTDLLALRRDGHLHPAFEQALVSTCQLATFIR